MPALLFRSTNGQSPALNLREAGFNVQVTTAAERVDLNLRTFALDSRDPQSSLESLLRAEGQPAPVTDASPAAPYSRSVSLDGIQAARLL